MRNCFVQFECEQRVKQIIGNAFVISEVCNDAQLLIAFDV